MADAYHGLMTMAMAYRVKYRQTDSDGKVVRKRVHIQSLGVHKKNRGGVYPAGVRCKSLCAEVVEVGFVKEEVLHSLVAVEERPLAHSAVAAYESGLAYNIDKCSKDEFLLTCFSVPHNEVWHMLLGHNHIMLVLRAFITNAKWDLEPIPGKGIAFCDHEGRLSIAAVAAHVNGKEIAELVEEGLDCEILSYKIDIEEPTAASLISQALNKGNELALRTTELTAVAVLKGEIIVQMSKNVAQRVAFQTVRDCVRQELSNAADDSDLPELFDFLIAAGVGVNSYVEDLLEFAGCFVDCKKRQLRFSAFGVANKMCKECPWSKIAVMKRAYRKKAVQGFCPSPEVQWGAMEWEKIRRLEEVLRFFHCGCKVYVDKLQPQGRHRFLANVDVAAADTFFIKASIKPKVELKIIEDALLEATRKFLDQLGFETFPVCPDMPWLDFTKCTKEAEAAVAAVEQASSAAAVIFFDEQSGAQQNQQRAFDEAKQKEGTCRAAVARVVW